MKKLFFFIFLLSLPIVYSIYGGESTEIFVDNCIGQVMLTIEADSQIDEGEYWLENCSKQNEYWVCNCSKSVNISFNTLPNTINNYTITAYYELFELPLQQVSSSSGGSSSRFYYYKIPEEPCPKPIETIKVATREIPINETIPETIEQINDTDIELVQDLIEPIKKKSILNILLPVLSICIFIGYFTYSEIKKRRKKKDELDKEKHI